MPSEFLERPLDYIYFFYGLAFLLLAAICATMVFFVIRQRMWGRSQHIARKQTEVELRKLTFAVEQSPATIVVTDVQGNIQYVNPKFTQVTGYTLDEMRGKNPRVLKGGETSQAEYKRLWDTILAGGEWRGEFHNRKKNGEYYWERAMIAPVTAADGTITNFMAIKEDITTQKQMEDDLRQSTEKLRLLLDSTGEAIYGVDLEGNCTFCNPACLRLLGYKRSEDLLGKNMHWLIHHTRADGTPLPAEECRIANAYRKGEGVHLDTEILWRADGTSFPVELWAHPQKVGDKIVGAVMTFVDITARKRFEKALKDAHYALEETNIELQRANTIKSQFLATMSHEIRTPLNAIIGMTGMLLDTKLDSEQKDCSETIRTSGEALLDLINDILDFSKLEAERMKLENQPFDLLRCVEDALGLLRTSAAEKNLGLAYEIEGELPWCYVGDVARLRQILANLLSNAVKFTDSGEVVVAISSEEHYNDHYELHFAVHDTGLGVPPDLQDRLFQSFSQLDAASNRRFGGTGLGLAISKRLCELMDGRMWIESTGIPGEGSTFHFTIHVAKAPADQSLPDERMAERAASLAEKKVLIVDGNKANRSILVAQTKRWSMHPTAVPAARKALDLLHRGIHFDLAILDMQTPDMNGQQLAEAIKTIPTAQAMPLVLVAPLSHHVTNSETACFAARLAKPVKASHLSEALCIAIGKPSEPRKEEPPRQSSTEPDATPTHRLRVLLAEDNPINQKVALKMLTKLGYRADVVSNGIEALQAFQQIPYDVILMDCQMPEVDGYEATRKIRMREQQQHRTPVHIIAMTANVMQGDREQCVNAGMDDYLGKPVRTHELQAILQRCRPITPSEDDATLVSGTEKYEPAATPALQQAVVITSTTVEPTIMASEAPALDIELLDENAEIGIDGLQELIDMYLTQADEILAALRTAIDAGESDDVNRLAHKLAGSSAVCGVTAMATTLREIEMCGREGRLSDADFLLAQTTKRLELCRRLLGEYLANKSGQLA